MQMWAVINQGIGHWPPSEMANMSLAELDDWYKIATEILDAKIKANQVK